MGANREEFLRVLEEQRAEYGRTIAGKIAGMQLLWRGICASNSGSDDMQRLVRTAHGLAGSGAMFGYDRLGARASDLERELLRILEHGTPEAREAASVDGAIVALRDCF